MEQAQLRIRAREKFKRSDELFFTRKGYEQSSGELIARYKASRFSQTAPIIDVCCGIGGDLMELAALRAANGGADVSGIDCSELATLLARRNLEVLGFDRAQVQASTFQKHSFPPQCQVHADPDRRAVKRTVRGELFEPGLPDLFEVQRFDLGLV